LLTFWRPAREHVHTLFSSLGVSWYGSVIFSSFDSMNFFQSGAFTLPYTDLVIGPPLLRSPPILLKVLVHFVSFFFFFLVVAKFLFFMTNLPPGPFRQMGCCPPESGRGRPRPLCSFPAVKWRCRLPFDGWTCVNGASLSDTPPFLLWHRKLLSRGWPALPVVVFPWLSTPLSP